MTHWADLVWGCVFPTLPHACFVPFCPVLSCPVLSCPVLSCPVVFCSVLFGLPSSSQPGSGACSRLPGAFASKPPPSPLRSPVGRVALWSALPSPSRSCLSPVWLGRLPAHLVTLPRTTLTVVPLSAELGGLEAVVVLVLVLGVVLVLALVLVLVW